jgi:hypothetical protein
MHSFQPSRGRVLLEFLCALAIVASLVGAWRQTQSSALLVAAGAVGLLGMIRLFDMGRGQAVLAEEPQRIELDPDIRDEAPALPAVEKPSAVEPVHEAERPAEIIEFADPDAPRAGAGRRKSGARKGNGRRTSARKAAEFVELTAVEVAEPVSLEQPTLHDASEIAEVAVPDVPEVEPKVSEPEPTHVPHAPLFEPEPFVRMPRQAFGRRGRL